MWPSRCDCVDIRAVDRFDELIKIFIDSFRFDVAAVMWCLWPQCTLNALLQQFYVLKSIKCNFTVLLGWNQLTFLGFTPQTFKNWPKIKWKSHRTPRKKKVERNVFFFESIVLFQSPFVRSTATRDRQPSHRKAQKLNHDISVDLSAAAINYHQMVRRRDIIKSNGTDYFKVFSSRSGVVAGVVRGWKTMDEIHFPSPSPAHAMPMCK